MDSNLALRISMGERGLEVISDTIARTSTTPKWQAINIIEDTTFTQLECVGLEGDLTASTYAAGSWLYGSFTTIQLASGSVIAYKR